MIFNLFNTTQTISFTDFFSQSRAHNILAWTPYQLPKNTPTTSVIDQIGNFNTGVVDNITKFNDNITKITYYLTNPVELLGLIIVFTANISYYLCLLICLWCIIAHVLSESDKVKSYAVNSFIVFLATQVIAMPFRG